MAARRRFKGGFALAGLALVGLVVWFITARAKPPAKPARAPSVSVATATVARKDIPVSINALGAAQAWQAVTIRAQVNGRLLSVPVREGGDVRKGDLLAEIDPAPYRAALLQAEGALARDRAALAQAKLDLKRYRTLVAQDSIARQTADTQAALVKQDEGTVMVDEGAVAAARVNLNYCRIFSPLEGRVGVRLVDAGNLVSTNDTSGIVTVNQVTPIAVTFTIPQGEFQRLANVSGGFRRALVTEALSQDTGQLLGRGDLNIADNHVDATTGTVAMKARFPNADKRLWPGQFVNVRLTLQTLAGVTTVPVGAVNQGPKGPFAYVVGFDHKATVRPLTITTTQDQIAVVSAGLKPGEVVVIDGQMTLKPGMAVTLAGERRGQGDGAAARAHGKPAA